MPSNILDQMLDDLKSRSDYTQMSVGCVAGVVAGFGTMKVGKSFSFFIGSGIILLQFAFHENWISYDPSHIIEALQGAPDKMESAIHGLQNTVDRGLRAANTTQLITVPFIGGVFLGLSFA